MPMVNKGIFYGWYMVLSGFFIMFSGFSIVNSLHSLFFVPVTEELNLSRTTFSIILSIGGLGMACGSPIMGKWLMKGNMKMIMSLCIILAGLGFMSYSFAQSAWYFGFIAFFIGVCVSGFSSIPISILLTNWFYEKKGLAMGLAFGGSGIGAAVLSPILSSLISNAGWRTAYLISGALIIVIALPLVLVFVKKSPADKGMVALGSEKNISESQSPKDVQGGLTWNEAKRSGFFWLFVFGVVCFSLVSGGVQMHIPAYLEDIGHPALFAGTIFGLLSLTNTVGKLVLGSIFDRYRTMGGILFVAIAMSIAMLSLMMAGTAFFAFVFAVAYGFSIVIATIGPPFITDDLFGKRDFGTIFGVVQVFFVVSGSLGIIVSGIIYDATESYLVAWIFFLGLFLLSMFCIALAAFFRNKSNKLPIDGTVQKIL
ncbi:MFS transporter [Bacillus testis]|uniref:MFS transporter n=1 Tax=Bacillus testis TaxID=1622072 RepID=UPI0009464658|nr:MFS transporter [Bacillus testis]